MPIPSRSTRLIRNLHFLSRCCRESALVRSLYFKPNNNPRLYPKIYDPNFLHLFFLRKKINVYAKQCYGTVVDYGAGSKPYQSLFRNVSKYIGADFYTIDSCDVNLRPDVGLPIKDEFADFVVSFQVLEHVPDIKLYLSECYRILRPNGCLILTTHGSWPYHPGPNNDDFWRWTGAGIELVIQKNNFEVLETEGICKGWVSVLQQLLVIRDPARTHRNMFYNMLYRFFCSAVNLFGLCISELFDRHCSMQDILPIVYIVKARKP
jgi:SAM-dependent methyltransferase